MEHTHPHQQRHMGSELGLWESSVAGVVFPTLIFCWLDVFFSPPVVPSFSRWKEKNGREQQQQAATRGEKERKLGGGEKNGRHCWAVGWRGGWSVPLPLPYPAIGCLRLVGCVLMYDKNSSHFFQQRKKKERGEREEKRRVLYITCVSSSLVFSLSVATNEKKGLGGPLKTQKKGEKEKNQCLLPTILSMYIIIKGNREKERKLVLRLLRETVPVANRPDNRKR